MKKKNFPWKNCLILFLKWVLFLFRSFFSLGNSSSHRRIWKNDFHLSSSSFIFISKSHIFLILLSSFYPHSSILFNFIQRILLLLLLLLLLFFSGIFCLFLARFGKDESVNWSLSLSTHSEPISFWILTI